MSREGGHCVRRADFTKPRHESRQSGHLPEPVRGSRVVRETQCNTNKPWQGFRKRIRRPDMRGDKASTTNAGDGEHTLGESRSHHWHAHDAEAPHAYDTERCHSPTMQTRPREQLVPLWMRGGGGRQQHTIGVGCKTSFACARPAHHTDHDDRPGDHEAWTGNGTDIPRGAVAIVSRVFPSRTS